MTPQRRALAAELLIAIALVSLCASWRLLTHTPNFTPVAASALFAGFLFRSRALALAVPLVAMLASDAVVGFYDGRQMAVVYAALAFPALLSGIPRARLTPVRVAAPALLSSAVFFVTTNLAVWLWSGWYEVTAAGLARCFVAALPFLKFTVAGDLAFSAALFGTYALATGRLTARAPRGAARA